MIRSVLVSMYVFLRYACSERSVLRSLEPGFLTTFSRSSGSKNLRGGAGRDSRAKMPVYAHAPRSKWNPFKRKYHPPYALENKRTGPRKRVRRHENRLPRRSLTRC
jgi:hypothetical protein